MGKTLEIMIMPDFDSTRESLGYDENDDYNSAAVFYQQGYDTDFIHVEDGEIFKISEGFIGRLNSEEPVYLIQEDDDIKYEDDDLQYQEHLRIKDDLIEGHYKYSEVNNIIYQLVSGGYEPKEDFNPAVYNEPYEEFEVTDQFIPINLKSFHGEPKEKQFYLDEVHECLNKEVDIFNPADCILNKYELFPYKLGLPLWLSSLLNVFYFSNAKGTLSKDISYEKYFYEPFLSACNVGVDYTPMLYKWHIFLLTNLIPQNIRENENIKAIIRLHEKALSGTEVTIQEWTNERDILNSSFPNLDGLTDVPQEILLKEKEARIKLNSLERRYYNPDHDKFSDELNHIINIKEAFNKIKWDSMRAALLSAEEAINVRECYISSVVAVVDTIKDSALITGIATSKEDERIITNKAWYNIMDQLLIMLKEWK